MLRNAPVVACVVSFLMGLIVGIALTGAYSKAGELYNVKPYPDGRVWVPGNVIVTMRNDKWDSIEMQCVPISQHDQTIRNPENYQR